MGRGRKIYKHKGLICRIKHNLWFRELKEVWKESKELDKDMEEEQLIIQQATLITEEISKFNRIQSTDFKTKTLNLKQNCKFKISSI